MGRMQMVHWWFTMRYYFIIDAVSILTPSMQVELIVLTVIAMMFFGGIGKSQIIKDVDKTAQSQVQANSTAIAVLNYKMDEKERRLELLETKMDLAIAQNTHIEANQAATESRLGWLVRFFGLGIMGLFAKFFHTVWERTMTKREYAGPKDRRETRPKG